MREVTVLILFFFLILFSASAFAQQTPSFPQEFTGEVEINEDRASEGRIIIAELGDERFETEVNSDGTYSVVISGREYGDEVVRFFTENKTGGAVEASTQPNSPKFESGGPLQEVDLSYQIEDPEPRVNTGSTIETGQNYALVEAPTRFLNEKAELKIEFDEYRSVTKYIDSSGEYEFNLTDLEYDTEYDYQAFLEVNGDTIKGSKRDFTTENRRGMNIIGESNVDVGRAEAWIDDELVFNESIENGRFSFEIDYEEAYRYDDVRVTFRDKEERVEFESGGERDLFFNITESGPEEGMTGTVEKNSSDEETQSENGTSPDATDDPDSNEESQENETSDNEETNPESETGGQNETRPQASESLTGDFVQNQVNNTTIVLFFALIAAGIYTLKNY